MNWAIKNPSNNFSREIADEMTIPSIRHCRECGKCTAVCPVAKWAVTTPAALVNLVICGEQERSVRADLNWLCMSCDQCLTACPEQIAISELTSILKQAAFTHGYSDETIAPVEMIPLLYETFWSNLKKRGKIWPLSLALSFKMKSFNFFDDTGTGLKMKSKGMLSLFPPGNSTKAVELLKKLADYEQTLLDEESEKTTKPDDAEPAEAAKTDETEPAEAAKTDETEPTTEPKELKE